MCIRDHPGRPCIPWWDDDTNGIWSEMADLNLVGGIPTPLKMMEFVNWKDDIPYMKWKIKHVPNHQPVMILMTHISNIWIGYDRIILWDVHKKKHEPASATFWTVHPCHSLVEPFNSRQVKHWRKCWQSVLTKAWGHKASLVRLLGCTTISHSTDQTCHSSSS